MIEVTREYDKPQSTISTSSEADIHGNYKGTDDIPSHEIDLFPGDLDNSCVELSVDLVTPSVVEDSVTDFTLPCDQPREIDDVLSAPLAEINSSFDLIVHNELSVDTNEPLNLLVPPNLDHIKLVRHDDVLAKIAHENSWWSIKLDPPMSLSHARDKIAEITCLNSDYAPNFTFNLIGDYGVVTDFVVHRICITCDKLARSKDNNIMHALSHFDMTSNVDDNYVPNNLIHVCLNSCALSRTGFEHTVNCRCDTTNFYSPPLGWFNDKRCKSSYMNKCFIIFAHCVAIMACSLFLVIIIWLYISQDMIIIIA